MGFRIYKILFFVKQKKQPTKRTDFNHGNKSGNNDLSIIKKDTKTVARKNKKSYDKSMLKLL